MRRFRTQREAVVRLHGELDISSTDRAQVAIEQASSDADASRLIVDLSALTFIDSRATALLVQTRARAAADGRRFQIVGATGAVARVIGIVAPELLEDLFTPSGTLVLAAAADAAPSY